MPKKLDESSLKPLWRPRETSIVDSPLQDFCQRFTEFKGAPRTKEEYERLWRWSLDAAEEFWSSLWQFSATIGSMGCPPFIEKSADITKTHFFPRATLNFAENFLRGDDEQIVLSSWFEKGEVQRLTRAQLRRKVEASARILLRCGVRKGDRVAAVLPNSAEAVVAMLGCTAIGGVWTSASPDFGAESIFDRFNQTRPKLLIIADGYAYNGKFFDRRGEMEKLAARLDSLEHVFTITISSFLGSLRESFGEDSNGYSFASHIQSTKGERLPLLPFAETLQQEEMAELASGERFAYPALPFNHPLCILYSSGTTGAPKCIVHRAGAVLLQHQLEHNFHCDIRRGDRVFFFTTCGWMMWNWLTSSLSSGAHVVLYDGSPLFDDGKRLWQIAESEKLTHFGAASKYYVALEELKVKPRERFDTTSLRATVATGSPLSPEGFDFIAHSVSASSPFPSSISGGSDLCGCFVMGCPSMPVYRGEISVPVLGMAAEVVDENARPLLDSMGELVCAQAFPTMPLGFFGDDSKQSRYRKAYFQRFPDSARSLWHQGDYAKQNSITGGIIIYGRSDATLNVAGVRIGTAEIYRQVEAMEEVSEAIAIEHKTANDTRMLLFVRLASGLLLDETLRQKIAERLRSNCSPRHVPSRIFAVPDIPRTRSGKITEIAVRDSVVGKPIANRGALANPQALDAFRALVLADQDMG